MCIRRKDTVLRLHGVVVQGTVGVARRVAYSMRKIHEEISINK